MYESADSAVLCPSSLEFRLSLSNNVCSKDWHVKAPVRLVAGSQISQLSWSTWLISSGCQVLTTCENRLLKPAAHARPAMPAPMTTASSREGEMIEELRLTWCCCCTVLACTANLTGCVFLFDRHGPDRAEQCDNSMATATGDCCVPFYQQAT